MNPHTNGEFNVMQNVIKNAIEPVCFIDGGANIGKFSSFYLQLCNRFNKKDFSLLAIEPFPTTRNKLEKSLPNHNDCIIPMALGDEIKKVNFYYDDAEKSSGSNSLINHYYLNKKIEIQQTTIDEIINQKRIKKVDFLKLDIEGFEYMALIGSFNALENNLIKYVMLEYNQTWIDGNGSIKKILDICHKFNYKLYRIKSNSLLSIDKYNYILDDFVYSNLLMVSFDSPLPLKFNRKVIPF